MKGESRRGLIVDTATRLFSYRGWRATGLIELAKEVGITHGAILHHFGSKENLLNAVVTHAHDSQQPVIELMNRHHGLETIREVLPGIGQSQVDNEVVARLYAALLAESFEPESPMHPYFKHVHQTLHGYYAKALREAQRANEVRTDVDPDLAANLIVAFIVGLQTVRSLDPASIDISATYDHQVQFLLRALLDSPPP